MMDFLRFKKMIVPFIIQIVFWLGSIAVMISGVYIMVAHQSVGRGLTIVILGPIAIRIACEIIMVFFRSYQTLVNIEENLEHSFYAQNSPLTSRQSNVAPGTKPAPLFDIVTGSNKTPAHQETPPVT